LLDEFFNLHNNENKCFARTVRFIYLKILKKLDNIRNFAGFVGVVEKVSVVAGERAADFAAGSGQCGENDPAEEVGVRGRDSHHPHSGLQHQVRPGRGIQAQRLGHRRTEEDQTLLEELL